MNLKIISKNSEEPAKVIRGTIDFRVEYDKKLLER